jgi:hypothetical protein
MVEATNRVSRPLVGGRAIERAARGAEEPRRRVTGPHVPRIPRQVVVLVGLSTAAYAGSLASVAALQSAAEASTVAERAPAAAALADAIARNDALAARLRDAASTQAEAAAAYDRLTAQIAAHEKALTSLAAKVAAVDGSSRSLPTSVAMPRSVRVVVTSGGGQTRHATTGGSGVP